MRRIVARFSTAPGAMTVAAGVPEDVLVATGVATVAMTAEGGRAAVGHGTHHLALGGVDGHLLEQLTTLGANDGTE